MKHIVALVFGLFAFTFSADAQVAADGENVSVTITHETTRTQLGEMATAFRAQGVEMRYDNIEWASGHLIRIRLRVKGAQGEIVEYFAENLSQEDALKVTRQVNEGTESLCAGLDCE